MTLTKASTSSPTAVSTFDGSDPWDRASRLSALSTCRGREFTSAVSGLRSAFEYDDPGDAAADANALFANPDLTFKQFARVLQGQLDYWLRAPGDERAEPRFSIDPWAPGARASDWWGRVLCPAASDRVAGLSHWWHREWAMHRAFVVTEPEHWPRLWDACWGRDDLDHATSDRLLGLLRYRSLGPERQGLLAEENVAETLFDQWQRPWDALRDEVPRSTSREQAQAGFSRLLLDPVEDAQRTTVTQQVRQALVADILAGRPRRGFTLLDRRFAVLTADDLRTLISAAGPCDDDAEHESWGRYPWLRAEVVRARTDALGLVPLDDALIAEHLACPTADHRAQLVLNPFVPVDAAAAAISAELSTIGSPRTVTKRHVRHEVAAHARQWWRVLLAVRGWLPSPVLEPAMQQVTAWMLDDHPLRHWLAELAVYASSPNGLRAMSPDQLAHFDAIVGVQANGAPMRWAPRRWRNDPDPHAPFMSDAVLRQMLALTGWKGVRLILDPAVDRLRPSLPVETRVLAARHGDDTTLATLVDDLELRVRQHVARNHRASTQTLDRLLVDPDPRVRSQVARNSGVTASHLERMCRDTDRRVSRAASRELLKLLAAA